MSQWALIKKQKEEKQLQQKMIKGNLFRQSSQENLFQGNKSQESE